MQSPDEYYPTDQTAERSRSGSAVTHLHPAEARPAFLDFHQRREAMRSCRMAMYVLIYAPYESGWIVGRSTGVALQREPGTVVRGTPRCELRSRRYNRLLVGAEGHADEAGSAGKQRQPE